MKMQPNSNVSEMLEREREIYVVDGCLTKAQNGARWLNLIDIDQLYTIKIKEIWLEQ